MSDIVNISTNPVVLRNRGFKIKLHKLEERKGRPGWQRVMDEESEFVYEDHWFKFTNATLAEIEDVEPFGFGSLENVQELFETVPFRTVAKIFAMVFEQYFTDAHGNIVPDVKYGGLLMLDGEVPSYIAVMGGALNMAQGGDPESVGVSVRRSLKETREQIAAQLAAADGTPTNQNDGSPSPDGSPDGQS